MVIEKENSSCGGKFKSFRRFLTLAACFSLVSASGDVTAITDCSIAYTMTSDSSAKSECTTSPCNPGNCTYSANTDATGAPLTGIGTFSGACGPITKCVLSGDDPPLRDPYWDEPLAGFQGLGATLMSGKCAPPKQENGYQLICPAAGYYNTSR